jgi:prepilin-type N-terminal cleavage/methylation domain-containing protein
MDRRAFTLIELLVTIVIIGLLAGLLLPVLGSASNQARRTGAAQLITQIENACGLYQVQTRSPPPEQGTVWVPDPGGEYLTWNSGSPLLRERICLRNGAASTGPDGLLNLLERVCDLQTPGDALRPSALAGYLELTDPWKQPYFYQRFDATRTGAWAMRAQYWLARTPQPAFRGQAGPPDEREGFIVHSVGPSNLSPVRSPPDPRNDTATTPGGWWKNPALVVYRAGAF